MNNFWIPVLMILAAFSTGRAEAGDLPPPPNEVSITVFKARHELWLFRRGRPIRIFQVFLGSSPTGHKTKRGDFKTPEGDYRIVEKKTSRKFHRFIGINYPNRKDADRAYEEGRITADQWTQMLHASATRSRPPWDTSLGGRLGIHGIGQDENYKLRLIGDMDWTNGCVALSNRDVEEIFRLVPLGAVVRIRE